MNNTLFTFFKFLSLIGGVGMMLIATTIVSLLVYFWSKEKILPKFILFNYLVTTGAIIVIKFLVQKPRNPLALVKENSYAFPSGHVGAAAVTFLLLFYFSYFVKSNFLKHFMQVFGTLWLFLIILARLYLKVHDIYDVLAAMIVALFIFYISTELTIFKKYRIRKDINHLQK